MSKEFDDFMDSVKQIAEESWEGCDGCTEQDEIMYKNGYVKGYNAAIAELPKEISDEEIEKASWIYEVRDKFDAYFIREAFLKGCEWYKNQLKQRQ